MVNGGGAGMVTDIAVAMLTDDELDICEGSLAGPSGESWLRYTIPLHCPIHIGRRYK